MIGFVCQFKHRIKDYTLIVSRLGKYELYVTIISNYFKRNNEYPGSR